jgi:hypothetical protein
LASEVVGLDFLLIFLCGVGDFMLRRRIFARSHAFLTRHATLHGQDMPMGVRTSIALLNNYLQSVNIQRRRKDEIGGGGVCEDVDAK